MKTYGFTTLISMFLRAAQKSLNHLYQNKRALESEKQSINLFRGISKPHKAFSYGNVTNQHPMVHMVLQSSND